jgi:hypothetical protein
MKPEKQSAEQLLDSKGERPKERSQIAQEARR